MISACNRHYIMVRIPYFPLILIMTIYILQIFPKDTCHHFVPYTPISSDLIKLVTPYLNTSSTIPSYTHSLRMLSEPLMALILTHLPPSIEMLCTIAIVPLQLLTLAIYNFFLCFLHTQSGWEGSVADTQMFYNSHFTDLSIPDGKYFLTDAGFPTCSTLLVPYCGTQYHLSELGCTQLRYGTTIT